MLTRTAALRKGLDQNCSALVKATMNADLTSDHFLGRRIHTWLERGFAKVYFVTNFMHGDRQAAAEVGVPVSLANYMGAVSAGILITTTMTAYAIAAHIPWISQAADRSLVRKLTKQLAGYGHAEFTTNAATYRPAHT